ncbi:MAG: glycosyltransferase family 2 protein [Isosphaeraceae bacterium]
MQSIRGLLLFKAFDGILRGNMKIMTPPTLSIITPSFNQGRFLEETILSVLNQRYPHLEYVVIDGGSTDDSVEVIRRYEHRLAYWVSETDRGQVHAINKGLERVTGNVVAFLNSDDTYLPGALWTVGNHFARHPECEWLCGDTLIFGEGHETRLIQARVPKTVGHCLCWAYGAPQPGMFWKRPMLAEGFSEKWQYDFDHEMYVRLLLAGHVCHHLPLPLASYRLHAVSKTVAEGHRQDEEFDRIAEYYEPHLRGAQRRWCRATRFLRRSYSASQAGNLREASRSLLKALLIHPEGLLRRPFWGCLRQALARSLST